jgi:hypothetical protein
MVPTGSGKVWHAEALSPAAEETIRLLGAVESIRSFYLAGGTGLALHLGHRRSVDLDLFSEQPFDEEALLGNLLQLKNLSVVARAQQTLHLHISGTKVSFLGYGYPLLFPFEFFRGFAVADILDIACMKLSALASRGTRRDFVDLYVIAREHGLAHLLEQFERKFAQVSYNRVHLLKSLVFFPDAEKDPMPNTLIPLSWEAVKSYFMHEVLKIGAK